MPVIGQAKLAEGRMLGQENKCGYVHRHDAGAGGGENEGGEETGRG